MKISELDQHCGNCFLIDLCGEPYSEVCLCANCKLADMTEKEYISKVNKIRSNSKRNWSNKTLEKLVIKSLS